MRSYNISNFPFTLYYGLIASIPNSWRISGCHFLSVNDANKLSDCETNLNNIRLCKKVSPLVYNSLLTSLCATPIVIDKWSYCFVTREDWPSIFKAWHSSVRESKIRAFQFKFLHRIVPTNNFLFKIGYVDSPLCTFCKASNETIDHLFFNCPVVVQFWSNVQRVILHKKPVLTREDIFFSYQFKASHPYNFLIFNAKFYLHCCRLKKIQPDVDDFYHKFSFCMDVESCINKNKPDVYFKLCSHFPSFFNSN